MKLYLKTGRRNHLMFCTPGLESDTSDFLLPDGTARQFTVRFVDGVAEVISPLGKWMIDKGLAQKTALIAPDVAVGLEALETRRRTHRILTDAYHEGAQ